MILIGEGSLRRAIGEFVVHYHTERNHQSLENKIIRPELSSRAGSERFQREIGCVRPHTQSLDDDSDFWAFVIAVEGLRIGRHRCAAVGGDSSAPFIYFQF
jgi:hypothetical protein